MGMQKDYHKIESNLNNAIMMAQQHITEAMKAHFNLTTAHFAEVAAAHMALWRHVETIAIGNAVNKEQRSTLLHDFAKQWEANQSGWIAYYQEQVAKQEKFNHDCQQWANEMNQ
jgi:regulator of RNase E activity RraB